MASIGSDGATQEDAGSQLSASRRDIDMTSKLQTARSLTIRLLREITDDFSDERKIGQGAYGKVFVAKLENGEDIAVKILHNNMPGNDDAQFLREFENLMRIDHENIVKLVGYCYETQHKPRQYFGRTIFTDQTYRALCFEYMENGSLQKYLSDESNGLDWNTRYKIIKGSWEGLKHLHQGLEEPIYHLDLKPDNILLDNNMLPKLADFGMSKIFKDQQTMTMHSPIGTFGYLPVEFIHGKIVSNKLDIFSLGVVMIKIIGGPEAHSRSVEMGHEEFLDLVQANWRNRMRSTYISRSLEAYCEQINVCAEIALACMEFDRHKRPNIADIIRQLNDTENVIDEECEDVLGDRLNLFPEFAASVKRAALEDAEKPGEVQPDARRAISPVCGDHNDGNKFDENAEVDQENDVHGSCDQHNSEIESTPAEAEALLHSLQIIKYDDLAEIRELGSGTYGAVFQGKWGGCDVAIKTIKADCFYGRPSQRERLIADFWKEALILSSLHHPNIVSFYGVIHDGPDGSLATVTEFMPSGSLKQFLRKKNRTIDRRKRVILAMNVAFGMEYLHSKCIVHFDLKCENLLLNMRDPQQLICKIGDLGKSKVRQHTFVRGGARGTLPWMAPELLSGNNDDMVSEKVDVYSFGIVMWELLTAEDPYSELRAAQIIDGVVNHDLRPQIPSWCEPEWKSLMEASWACEPTERPSFTEISQRLRKMVAAMNVE